MCVVERSAMLIQHRIIYIVSLEVMSQEGKGEEVSPWSLVSREITILT